jgi:hypothetical protein
MAHGSKKIHHRRASALHASLRTRFRAQRAVRQARPRPLRRRAVVWLARTPEGRLRVAHGRQQPSLARPGPPARTCGCVATSEHHGGHAHVLILRHVAPRLAHALGRLAAGGAAKRTAGNSPTPFTAQGRIHASARFATRERRGNSSLPTPTRRAWAACSGDALVGSPPRARTAPHVFLGARCQQRCGTSHGTGNARTHLGWRSGKRRGAIILAPTAARRAGKLGALRGTALRA